MSAVNRRGKVIAASTVAVGLAVLVAAGYAAMDRMCEEWYLWQLEEGDEQEQMIAAKKLGELKSARAASRLVAAFRMNAKKATKHSREQMSLRMDFRSARVYKGYIEVSDHGILWAQLLRLLMEVGKPATIGLLRGAADEDDVAVAMCMLGALLEIHGYPSIGANPWSRSRPTIQGELVLRHLWEDPSSPHDTRLLASEVLKKWFSD